MTPSKQAIEVAERIFYEGFKHDADDPKLTRMLEAAYAIDVAPLEAALREAVGVMKTWVRSSKVSGPLYEGCNCKDCKTRAAIARAEEVLGGTDPIQQ